MSHTWTDRLSAYLDDDLSPPERETLDRHLRGCGECRAALEDLRDVVAGARTLADRLPAGDLWPGIAAALVADRLAARSHGSWIGAVAAGVLLAVTTGLTAWVALDGGRAPVAITPDNPASVVQAVSSGNESSAAAVEDLLAVLETRRDQLSPRTIEVIERNLAIIDRAIAESTQALAEEPDDVALARRVVDQQQTKLAVLRQVERLTVDLP